MKKSKQSNDSIRRFEDLPDTIVHEIMCFLPLKDAIRSRTVSKKFSYWDSNSTPVLNVDNFTFLTSIDLRTLKDNAKPWALRSEALSNILPLDFVARLLRRRAPNMSLHKLRLRVASDDYLSKFLKETTSDPIADEVIDLALEKGATELSLKLSSDPLFCYIVPSTIFTAHSVKLLDLDGFQVNQPNMVLECPLMEELRLRDSSGLEEIQVLSPKLRKAEFVICKGLKRIEIKSLTLESFTHIQKNDNVCVIEIAAPESVKCIFLDGSSVTDLSKFTALESLRLDDCKAMTCLRVSSDGLKSAEVTGCDKLESIVIQSQSLETFKYEIDGKERRECEIRLLGCERLQKLVLVGASVTDSWFIDHMARFALLESITLRECYLWKKLVICGNETLRSLVLESCSADLEVECRAQNLDMFVYKGELIPSPPLVIAKAVHAKLSLKLPPKDTHYEPIPPWISPSYGPFKKLRDFLSFYGHCKTVTLVVNKELIFPAKVRDEMVRPFYGMNHLKLEFCGGSMPVVKLVDSALWLAPHLHTLTLVSSKYGTLIIKLDYGKTLTMAEDEEEEEEEEEAFKCWRHKVTKVTIEKGKCKGKCGHTCSRLIDYFWNSAETLEEILVTH